MGNDSHCKSCSLAKFCLPYSLDELSLEKLSQHIKAEKLIKKKTALYQKGHAFRSLYAVKSGAFKAFFNSKDQEIVTAFYLPGDIIGFDGVKNKHYAMDVVALSDGIVCEIRFDTLKALSRSDEVMHGHLLELMSHEIIQAERMHAQHNAEVYLASFLLDLSARFHRRGLSSSVFQLPMTRQDIANYLGLALETVSRLLSQLQSRELIQVEGRLITIISLEKLKALI